MNRHRFLACLLAALLLNLAQNSLATSGCATLAFGASLAASASGPADRMADHAASDSLLDQPMVACNRAMSLHVHAARLSDRFDDREALPGHRWLVLDASFENHMPVDLILGLGYQEAVLVGSIERQLFLLVNDQRVYRARLPENSEVPDSFVIGRAGDRVHFKLAYPVPDDDLSALSLRYYHDEYQPIAIDLLDAGTSPTATAGQRQANDLLELVVHDHQLVESYQGVAPPEQMQWLVVDLRGRGLWTTEADARALDVKADLNDKARQPRVLEYMEAARLLQARVDGRHAYTRDFGLGGMPTDPPFLPDSEAGGMAVFAIPIDAQRVELLAQFPQFGGREISRDIRPTARFTLVDGPAAPAPETLLEIEDAPVPMSVHRIERMENHAGHSAGADEQLLRVIISQRNLSDTGGMMQISQRLGLENGAELVGAYLRGPLPLEEPFWLPPGDEAREFELLIRAPADLDELAFSYNGVSGRSSHRLDLP